MADQSSALNQEVTNVEEFKKSEEEVKDDNTPKQGNQEVRNIEEEVKDEITLKEDNREAIKASSWTEAQAVVNKEHIPNPEESEVKPVKLNYILDELKNMKVAKANLKKPMTIHRIEKDDVNTRYELNSALYLGLKEELDLMGVGYTWGDNDNDIKMVLEEKHNEEDKADNNPKTVMRWKITDLKNKFESKVTMNLYHTNQGVHLQGGRKNGQVTTCSIAADMFETWSMIVSKQKSERIRILKETMMGMDLRKKPFQTASRLLVKAGPQRGNVFKCDLCAYKSVKITELKRHIFILHRHKTNPHIRKVTDAKKRLASPPKTAPPSKKEAEEKEKEKDIVNMSDCLNCEFECEDETLLEKHMKDKHEGKLNYQIYTIKELKPKNVVQSITTDMVDQAFKKMSSDAEKETAEIKQKNTSLNEEVDILKLKVGALSLDLKHERDLVKTIKKEKEEVETNYQEAARTIAEQQGQITIREEQIKVLGELLSLDEKISSEEVKASSKEDGWEEVYEDVTESGNMLPHQEKSMLTIGCKKCDKVLKSDHELREHMKRHIKMQNKMITCSFCDHTTNDENDLINHVVDNHSPKHTCATCNSEFSTKTKMMEHILRDHGFTFTANTQPETKMQCHDCNEKFSTKSQLMEHKTQKHYKTRLCPFFHGTGRGCSFPSNVCFNIHEENITPTETEAIDYRKRIICKNGENCVFKQRGTCFYKHIVNNVGTSPTPQLNSRSIPAQATQVPQG